MQRVGGRWMGADGLMHAWDACHVSAWPGGGGEGKGGGKWGLLQQSKAQSRNISLARATAEPKTFTILRVDPSAVRTHRKQWLLLIRRLEKSSRSTRFAVRVGQREKKATVLLAGKKEGNNLRPRRGKRGKWANLGKCRSPAAGVSD